MSKRYFSAESRSGTSTSHGFCNDTLVLVFSSEAARNLYVAESRNISCEIIPACKATLCATNYDMNRNRYDKPKPFTEDYWGIYRDYATDYPDGCIGELTVCNDRGYAQGERLYNRGKGASNA